MNEETMNEKRDTYVIEARDSLPHHKWKVVGAFHAGSQWRDHRVVNDETMREEVRMYRDTWPHRLVRVIKPDGSILEEGKDYELVLGIPRDELEKVCLRVRGSSLVKSGFMPSQKLADAIITNPHLEFRRRGECEQDPEFKQVITYTLVVHPPGQGSRAEILSYRRGKAGSEDRLHGAMSVGYGGHINPEDGGIDPTFFTGFAFDRAAARELREELTPFRHGPMRVLGVVNNDMDPVGRVHVGIVGVVFTTDDVRDQDGNDSAMFRGPEALRGENLEVWSRLIMEHTELEDMLDGNR